MFHQRGVCRHVPSTDAGIEPTFTTYTGPDPLGYVVSLNLRRRHLDESQRARVAAKIATIKQGARADLASIEAMSQDATAELLNVSRSGAQRARTMLEHGQPELVKAVEHGTVAVSTAADVATLPARVGRGRRRASADDVVAGNKAGYRSPQPALA